MLLEKYDEALGEALSLKIGWLIATVMLAPIPICAIIVALILNPSRRRLFFIYAIALLAAIAFAELMYLPVGSVK
jgi:hypothetical protein